MLSRIAAPPILSWNVPEIRGECVVTLVLLKVALKPSKGVVLKG